jgi:hypothetical protein
MLAFVQTPAEWLPAILRACRPHGWPVLTILRWRLPHIDWLILNEPFTLSVLENFLVTVSQVTCFLAGNGATQQNAQVDALLIGPQAEQPAQ